MSDGSDAATEGAKAVQEVGKTARACVDPLTDLGRYIGRVLGTTPEDLVGLAFGDYMAHARIRQMAGHQQKTDEILRMRGTESPQPINPKLAIPALIAVSEEGDETIQELWARLFANAMDPAREVWLNERLIDSLRKMDGADPLVSAQVAESTGRVSIETIQGDLGLRSTVSLWRSTI